MDQVTNSVSDNSSAIKTAVIIIIIAVVLGVVSSNDYEDVLATQDERENNTRVMAARCINSLVGDQSQARMEILK